MNYLYIIKIINENHYQSISLGISIKDIVEKWGEPDQVSINKKLPITYRYHKIDTTIDIIVYENIIVGLGIDTSYMALKLYQHKMICLMNKHIISYHEVRSHTYHTSNGWFLTFSEQTLYRFGIAMKIDE